MASKMMLLGQVLQREVVKPRIVNVRVVQQVFDKHINMFFPEPKDYKVVEEDIKAKSGDIVRIQKLDEPLTVEVHYKIAEVVFPIGYVVDPVTQRRCRGMKYIDEQAREEEAKRVADAKAWKNYSL